MNDALLTTTYPEYEFPVEPRYHTIMLIAYTDEGCYDTTYNVVEILDKLIFYVPNTFTPDGNNFNDHFLPVFTSGYDAEDYNMVIFNRWGEQIGRASCRERDEIAIVGVDVIVKRCYGRL